MKIPIYRAKKIDSDEYVEGFYIEDYGVASYIQESKYLNFIVSDRGEKGMEVDTMFQIDPTTIAIHFPNMIDSQGNKIFASLRVDGRGGDICNNFLNKEQKMREFKFRAWDNKNKIMTAKVSLNDVSKGFLGLENNVVMQYTGLKDRNGKEIYEGDILKLEESNESYETKYLGNRFVLCKYDNIVFENEAYFRERQVVGNIYKNPELLKED